MLCPEAETVVSAINHNTNAWVAICFIRVGIRTAIVVLGLVPVKYESFAQSGLKVVKIG